MALIDWTGLDSAYRLDGGTVRLRPPKASDYAEWAAVRTASREFLQPWEPTWARDDLTRAAFRRRLDAWRRDIDLGVTYPFFVFSQETGALTGGITLSNVRRGVAQTGTVGYWSGVHTARRPGGDPLRLPHPGPLAPGSGLRSGQRTVGRPAAQGRLHRGGLCAGLSEN